MKHQICLNIQSLRSRHGLSQEELAWKVGVSRQSIGKWESGESLPDILNCCRLAEVLDVSLDALVEDPGPLPIAPRGKHYYGAVSVNERGQIVIPKRARELFHIQTGDSLLVLADEEKGLALIKPDQIDTLIKQINA